jgi:hypothetical protein
MNIDAAPRAVPEFAVDAGNACSSPFQAPALTIVFSLGYFVERSAVCILTAFRLTCCAELHTSPPRMAARRTALGGRMDRGGGSAT